MMVNEPFDVTDDNGITVTGTVDVYRDPNGDYHNRAKPESDMNPRFADVRFNYFNTREACTIDRNALRKAMEESTAPPRVSKIIGGAFPPHGNGVCA
jgi:hypothetical protein